MELAGLQRLLSRLGNDAAFRRKRLGFGDGGLINFFRLAASRDCIEGIIFTLTNGMLSTSGQRLIIHMSTW
jgi:hypothetical protein